ncbi:plastocyanin/azurin family copper-binding protein [Halogranum rubrum]|uniref:plastocyanin/azurin family copper-binding protein n=1 Tax=Halogranum rubrum TaxID=553466 RepID=UPI000677C725|nr:plastocyanin/azurin family copper-binding protein [Halogranum salarium]
MNRREFLRAAGGSAAAVAATAQSAAAQEGGGNESSGGGGGGGTQTVAVGPGNSLVFEPAELAIAPGTTVEFVWESDGHNVVPESVPEGASWEGTGPESELFDTGHTYTHTFSTLGDYEYVCSPHATAGMVGTITVTENPGSGGGGEKELHELGVPIQAHWVGASTILGIIVTIVYTFYILKYGESANTGNTGGGE